MNAGKCLHRQCRPADGPRVRRSVRACWTTARLRSTIERGPAAALVPWPPLTAARPELPPRIGMQDRRPGSPPTDGGSGHAGTRPPRGTPIRSARRSARRDATRGRTRSASSSRFARILSGVLPSQVSLGPDKVSRHFSLTRPGTSWPESPPVSRH
jgi:hypothetical protein